MAKCIVEDAVNSGRQVELDIARGLAVLFMIFIHAQLYFANSDVTDGVFGVFNSFVGSVPAAPVFMFLMGIGINYSRRSQPKLLLKRGFILFLGGYLLNFLRGYLPQYVMSVRTGDVRYINIGITELMAVDILHFAGLVMMMFGLFKLMRISVPVVGLVGGVLALSNLFIGKIEVENFWLSSLAGLFWGVSESSSFPFLTWVPYPIMGFVFGSLLVRCADKKKFYTDLLIVSSVLFIVGTLVFNVILGIPNGMMTEVGYYHHIITDNITFLGLVVIEISLIFLAVRRVPPILEKTVARWSRNVTPIFFIHWVIITWTALAIPVHALNLWQFILLLAVLVPLSDLLAWCYARAKTRLLA